MSTTSATTWSARADIGHRSLDHFFGTGEPQLFNNTYPSEAGDNATFNYWWLSHVIDVRLDAYERSGNPERLQEAIRAYQNIFDRNGNTLFNDYFDDMLWYALAILRLYDATGESRYLSDARAIWEHVVEFGWNDQFGDSLAWRKQQLYYKNTPANGPFIILSCRLFRHTPEQRFRELAETAYAWLTQNLVAADTGFVEDGINREKDGRIDTQWRFTYNQGLYIGACLELGSLTGASEYSEQACRTAITAIEELSADGVFRQEGDGGDEGLFKGVYYRYMALLLRELDPQSDPAVALTRFIESSTDALWANGIRDGLLLPGNDWSTEPAGKISYSTQLSAMMALEVRAGLDVG